MDAGSCSEANFLGGGGGVYHNVWRPVCTSVSVEGCQGLGWQCPLNASGEGPHGYARIGGAQVDACYKQAFQCLHPNSSLR